MNFAVRPVAADPAQLPTPALIAHIVERYHEAHRRQLPQAIRLALRVEVRHLGHPAHPNGLADLLGALADELEPHHQREETILFPMLAADLGGPLVSFPIERMVFEHAEMGAKLAALAELTADFHAPPSVCATWRSLMETCREIDADLREHMRLENSVLFARFVAGADERQGPG